MSVEAQVHLFIIKMHKLLGNRTQNKLNMFLAQLNMQKLY